MKKDYSYLEGKEIKYVTNNKHDGARFISDVPERYEYDAVVTGCDYDLGISIQKKDNLDHYFVCVNGPSSPLWAAYHRKEVYKRVFMDVVKRIESGTYDASDIVGGIPVSERGNDPSAEFCPFAQ